MKIDNTLINNLLVKIPAGVVEMRDDRIKKKWSVEIQSFCLSKYLITQELYHAITHENPSTFKGDNLPVETVSWKEAVNFCNKLSVYFGLTPSYTLNQERDEIKFFRNTDGFRLPTEAEWQYACQAGSTEIRYGDLDKISWHKNNSQHKPHEVGKKAPNEWGLYDMLGNVWEWCSDMYDETVYGSYRVLRGGGWCDEERSIMATVRRRSHPTKFKIDDLGFRIAKNLTME